jgi:serine/threonine-protein kinase
MMGVVFRALDPALGRVIALKTVSLAWATSEEDRKAFEMRFLAEARVAAGLSHPGIVVVHDIGEDATTRTLFIAMEFLEGRTLAELTSGADRPLEWREALRIAARVAEALHHAHGAGIVHRDVKPANVMMLRSGDPKIMDFGIAKVPSSQLTGAGEFFGTPSYMSPEQALGLPVDGRSDLFSLGSVLYLLLTGRRAFDASSVPAILARVTSRDPPAPSRVVTGLPGDVDYLVRRALAKRPSDRYPSGAAFAEDLADAREGRAPRHRPGWVEPARVEGTLLNVGDEPETADLWRGAGGAVRQAAIATRRSPRPGRRLLALLAGGIGAVGLITAILARGDRSPTAPQPPAPGNVAPAPQPSPTAAEPADQGLLPFRLPRILPTPEPAPEPARLDVSVVHPLKSGSFRLWVDDTLSIDRPLYSRVQRKLLVIKSRKGRFRQSVDVAPGEHRIRVRLEGDGFGETRQLWKVFESGESQRLIVDLGGILTRDLIVEWAP